MDTPPMTDLQHEFTTSPSLTSANLGDNVVLGCDPPEGSPRPIVRYVDIYSIYNISVIATSIIL